MNAIHFIYARDRNTQIDKSASYALRAFSAMLFSLVLNDSTAQSLPWVAVPTLKNCIPLSAAPVIPHPKNHSITELYEKVRERITRYAGLVSTIAYKIPIAIQDPEWKIRLMIAERKNDGPGKYPGNFIGTNICDVKMEAVPNGINSRYSIRLNGESRHIRK